MTKTKKRRKERKRKERVRGTRCREISEVQDAMDVTSGIDARIIKERHQKVIAYVGHRSRSS